MQEDNNNNKESWSFQDESSAYSSPSPQPIASDVEPISWTGSEFIANQKDLVWYLGLAGFIFLVCAATYLLTKDEISVIFIVVMGVLFGVIAGRKPKQVQYTIDNDGIKVGQRSYLFGDFKSFSIQQHEAMNYVSLLPLHRFHNELSIYYPPELEAKIFEAMSQNMPNDQRKENSIDKLAKMIRF